MNRNQQELSDPKWSWYEMLNLLNVLKLSSMKESALFKVALVQFGFKINATKKNF